MKHKIPLQQAREIAEKIVDYLKPYCRRIEIAGSIRRKKAEVGDIEIVAIPFEAVDLFGPSASDHLLNHVDWFNLGVLTKNGPKYKQVELRDGINLDLFIVTPPAQWGVIFLIRTGPAEFSHGFVTTKRQGGLLPSYLRVKDGAIWHIGKGVSRMIETPEEADVFKILGIDYIEPEKRIE